MVALESTLIAHGLPWPVNREVALAAEATVRSHGAVPATIAVLNGQVTIGLTEQQLTELATSQSVHKASRRDLGPVLARKLTAATTVSATMAIAHQVGIHVFATGGLGGAHRPPAHAWDISSDLTELARTPLLVVCAGAKNLLDLPRTLEILETHGVPVIGYRTQHFPEFICGEGALPVPWSMDQPADVAACYLHQRVFGTATVLANPLPQHVALSLDQYKSARTQAETDAQTAQIGGPKLTPYLLKRIAELTHGASLLANQQLILNNVGLAADCASAIQKQLEQNQ